GRVCESVLEKLHVYTAECVFLAAAGKPGCQAKHEEYVNYRCVRVCGGVSHDTICRNQPTPRSWDEFLPNAHANCDAVQINSRPRCGTALIPGHNGSVVWPPRHHLRQQLREVRAL